jgi:hypothetical protein
LHAIVLICRRDIADAVGAEAQFATKIWFVVGLHNEALASARRNAQSLQR